MNNTTHKTMLSEHFSLEELTYSRIAVENALDNEPPPVTRLALEYLASHLLEPLRLLYKAPVAILSGYRSEAVNSIVGGVGTSQHMKGEAADCYIPEGPAHLLGILKKSGLLFDQAIVYRKRNFLHLSLKETGFNRMQVLFYLFCMVFLLPSCHVRREGMNKEVVLYADSLLVTGKDSFLFDHRISVEDLIDMNMTRLVLLPPDSNGRQYPTEITVLQSNRHHLLVDTTGDRQFSSMEVVSEQTGLSTSSSQKVYKQSIPLWMWVAGGGILLMFLSGFRK